MDNDMTAIEIERSLTGSFAAACEQLNDFARSLRENPRFVAVRTGADIRSYPSGWRLAKWIEAEFPERDLWAVWWIEFGPNESGWVIESHVAIDPDVFHREFEPRYATSAEMAARGMSDEVARLKGALQDNPDFASAVMRRS